MKRLVPLALAVLLVTVRPFHRAEITTVAALAMLGAEIRWDIQQPDHPIVSVTLMGKRVNDAELKHLGEFKNLRVLMLIDTQVTDAGLKELRNLINLQVLNLEGSKVTDAG